MSTLIQWSGDGLSGNLTTSSADANDTAPSFITGTTPTIVPVGTNTPAIRFAQTDATANYAIWVFSGVDLTSYAIRVYATFAGFVPSDQANLMAIVNAGETLLSWGVAVDTNRRVRLFDKNGATQATGTEQLDSITRYRFEAVVEGSQYDVYVYDGDTLDVVDHLAATLASPVSGGRVRLGNGAGLAVAPPFYLDDLFVTNTAALIGPASGAAETSAGLNATAILDAVTSHAETLGQFERVNGHEPKNAPGNGLSCAVWVASISPARGQHGLAQTSARVVLNVRVFSPMLQEPQDGIDPAVMEAVDALMNAYSGDFTLGGNVRNVDLLGMAGVPMEAQAGYLNQDNRLYRVMTITLPLIVSDVWEQVA